MGASELLRLKRDNPDEYRATLASIEASRLGGSSSRSASPPPATMRGMRTLDPLVEHFRRAMAGDGDDVTGGIDYGRRSNAVYACARLRATNIAGLPIRAYRFGTGGRGTGRRVDVRDPRKRMGMPAVARGRRIAEAGAVVEVETSPVLERLARPNVDWTGRQMIYATEWALCLEGQAKWLAERGATGKAPPEELAYVLASRLEVVKAGANDPFRSIAGWTMDRYSADRRDLSPGEVIWYRYIDPADPDYGCLSPLDVAKLAADAYTSAMRSNRDLFERGLAATGMILPEDGREFESDEQRLEFERDVNRMLMGKSNRHAVAVMPYRFDVESFSISPKDAEFTALMDYAIEDVGRAYGVPIEFIGGSRRTYQNLGEAQASLWANTLEPEAVFLAEELTGKLLPMFGADGAGVDFLAFDLSDVAALQEDEAARWMIDKEQLASGAVATNEWREREGLEPRPGETLLPAQLSAIITALQALNMGTMTSEQAIGVISVGVGLGDDVAAKLVGDVATAPPVDMTMPADDVPVSAPPAGMTAMTMPAPPRAETAADGERVPPLDYGSDEHARWWGERAKAAEARVDDASAVVRQLFARQRDSLAMSIEDASRSGGGMDVASIEAMFDRRRWLREFREAIRPGLAAATMDGAEAVAGDIEARKASRPASRKGPFQFDKDAKVINFLRERAQRFAVQVNDTTWQRLKAKLETGIVDGKGGRELASIVRETFGVWTAKGGRAEVIARTEVIGAFNGGGLLYAKHTGLALDKEWITALDERVRESHRAAHGQRVGLDDDFEVGSARGPAPGQMDEAGESVQCRCVVRYVPIGDAAESQESDSQASGPVSPGAGSGYAKISDPAAFADQHFADWAKSLTPAEASGVAGYTGAAYRGINSILRGIDLPEDYSAEKVQSLRKMADAVEAAVGKGGAPENMVVYRGLSGEFAKAGVGDEIRDAGFLSTSMDEAIGKKFAWWATEHGTPDGIATMLELRVPKGTPGAPASMLSTHTESEFLIQRGSRMRVVEVTMEDFMSDDPNATRLRRVVAELVSTGGGRSLARKLARQSAATRDRLDKYVWAAGDATITKAK